MNFWDRFVVLCAKKKISTSRAIRALQIPKSTVSAWKMGIWPHGVWLDRLSQYFDEPKEKLTGTPEYRMLGDPADKPIITEQEWRFIRAYRQNPHLQRGVDKLLDIPDGDDTYK